MKGSAKVESGLVYRLARGPLIIYYLKIRDRCRSGLSGTPGKRVLVKANRGFESLPVRSVSKDREFHHPEGKSGWREGWV